MNKVLNVVMLDVAKYRWTLLCLCAAAAGVVEGSISSGARVGWLDRVVQYHKNRLYADVKRLPHIQIKATLSLAPPGYVDSKQWDFESVVRLLTLMRESETAHAAYRALRRALRPARRMYMSKKDSYKYFPNIQNNYYDDSMEYSSGGEEGSSPYDGMLDDERAVIIVTNPVEARLPGASISVRVIRDILESRARAARVMPPTTRQHIDWKPMNKTTRADVTNGTDSTDNSTTTAGTAGNATDTTVAESDGSPSGGESPSSDGETTTPNGGETPTPADGTTTPEGKPAGRRRRTRAFNKRLYRNV